MNMRLAMMRGISLLEGLVAVVVLAVGLLALFRLQADVLRSGTDAKARTEALQIAEGQLGELRDTASRYPQFVADNGGSDEADFPAYLGAQAGTLDTRDRADVRQRLGSDADITTTVSSAYPPTVSVLVEWTGAGGMRQQVQTAGLVTLKDPTAGMILAEKDSGGGMIKAPTGDARYGRGINPYAVTYRDAADDLDKGTGDERGVKHRDNNDGVIVVYNRADTLYQLVDKLTGVVRIESGTALGTISGTVYVTAAMAMNRDFIRVSAPDVSWCTTPANQRYTVIGPAGRIYDALPYYCYVGTAWYGAIGPVADDPAVTSSDPLQPERSEFGGNDEVCVGEDGVPSSGESDSRHPQLSFILTYRGYFREPTGAVDADGNPVYDSQGVQHPKDGAGNLVSFFERPYNDFVIDTFPGNPADTDCDSRLAAGDAATATESNPAIDPPYVPPLPPVAFTDNPGAFYCLTESCPDPLPENPGEAVDSTAARIYGAFVLKDSDPPVSVPGGVVTTSDTGAPCEESGGSYECTVYVVGATGSWNGTIVAAPPPGHFITSDNGGHQRTVSVTPLSPAMQDFVVAPITVQPRTIGGQIDLVGARYNNVLSSHGGDCRIPIDRNTPVAGPFGCAYASLASGTAVTLTVDTNKVLCPRSGTPSAFSSVAGNSLTITGVSADLSDVTLIIRNRAGDCPP